MSDTTVVHDVQIYLVEYEKQLRWNVYQKWKHVPVYDGPTIQKPKRLPKIIGHSKRDLVVFTAPYDAKYKLQDLEYTEAHLKSLLEERGVSDHEGFDETSHPDASAEPWMRFAHAYYRFPKTCSHSPHLSTYALDTDSVTRLLALYMQVHIDRRKLANEYPAIPRRDRSSEIDTDSRAFRECYES